MNNKEKNKIQNKQNDVSMNPNINEASGLSTNSIIFKGGTLENINKLSEINKITNTISSSLDLTINDNFEYPIDYSKAYKRKKDFDNIIKVIPK